MARREETTPGRGGELAAEPGRRSAFEALTQARLQRAYRLATALLRDSGEAEDAVHDAAIQAWLHWQDLRDPTRMSAWFDRIVVNECRQRMRRRRAAPIPMAGVPGGTSHDDLLSSSGERDALRSALAALDIDQRVVIVLRVVEDLTIPQIAAQIGEREGTIKSRLHYALSALRAAYDAAERLEENSHG